MASKWDGKPVKFEAKPITYGSTNLPIESSKSKSLQKYKRLWGWVGLCAVTVGFIMQIIAQTLPVKVQQTISTPINHLSASELVQEYTPVTSIEITNIHGEGFRMTVSA